MSLLLFALDASGSSASHFSFSRPDPPCAAIKWEELTSPSRSALFAPRACTTIAKKLHCAHSSPFSHTCTPQSDETASWPRNRLRPRLLVVIIPTLLEANVSLKTRDEIMRTWENQIQDKGAISLRIEGEILLRTTFVNSWNFCCVDSDMMRVIWSVGKELKNVRTKSNVTDESLNSERSEEGME